jgi:tetratricopeptide (TPR) repeat protein
VARKKPKHHGHPVLAIPDLGPRIERAAREGRYQQALELAKQLHKREPTPANRELLRNTYLGRARQLRSQGNPRDAVTVLIVSMQLDGASNDYLRQVAQELAACGAGQEALRLLGRLGHDPAAQGPLLGRLADTAVQRGPDGRTSLPADLRADFDRVMQATTQIDAGQDDQALTTLQGVGLRSPFLEWKVMLRGLIAYFQKDDERAVENWQRLTPERLPARVVAPLRFAIDGAYRTAQPPEAQSLLRKQADRLQDPTALHLLRQVQKALGNPDSLGQAFRLAQEAVASLRREAPHLVPRLAACFYWAVIHDGDPEDESRYQRVFGTPADDPQLARMKALALEAAREMEDAHREWQSFERSVATNPAAWPGGQAVLVRALVWKHMGMNAAAVPDFDRLPPLPPFLRDQIKRPRQLRPSAEACFRRSLELAPDQLETHEALVHYYLGNNKPKQAEEATRQLLARFPTHVPSLERLADLRIEAHDYAEGINLLEQAVKANPLDWDLRHRLKLAHLFQARAHAEAWQFEPARAEFRQALALGEGENNSEVYCKMAACEFKAGDSVRAEEYLQQALTAIGSRLSVTFSLLIEIIRLKLPARLKTRFNNEFNTLLSAPPEGATAAAIAATAAAHRAAGVNYRGQQTHEKKVLTYLQKALAVDLNEQQLDTMCTALFALKAQRLLQDYAQRGQQLFPFNPWFPYWEVQAYVLLGPYRCPRDRARFLLAEVRRLAADMPRDLRKEVLLEEVKRCEDLIAVASPFLGLDPSMFPNNMFENFFDDDDEDDEDDY